MRILNITYNNAKGGVEQAFCDHTRTLTDTYGHEVFCFVPKDIKFLEDLVDATQNINFSRFLRTNLLKPLLYLEMKAVIRKTKPDLIIYHNERNIKIVRKSSKDLPLVAVNHGCKTKNMYVADHIFTVNKSIAERLENNGYPKEQVTVINNMIGL